MTARSAPAAGEGVTLLARADVAQLAGERAAAEGRAVAGTEDVAAAILAARAPAAAGDAPLLDEAVPTPLEAASEQPALAEPIRLRPRRQRRPTPRSP